MLLGFSLLILGITSLALQLVGVKWVFLSWLDKPGMLFGFVAKVIMVMASGIIIALANTNWEKEKAECLAEDENPAK